MTGDDVNHSLENNNEATNLAGPIQNNNNEQEIGDSERETTKNIVKDIINTIIEQAINKAKNNSNVTPMLSNSAFNGNIVEIEQNNSNFQHHDLMDNEPSASFMEQSFSYYLNNDAMNNNQPSAPCQEDIIENTQGQLIAAIKNNDLNQVNQILQNNQFAETFYHVDETDQTLFTLAVKCEDKNILVILQSHFASRAIDTSISFANRTMFKRIEQNDINGLTNDFLAKQNPNYTNSEHQPLLHVAIQNKNSTVATIEYLLQLGAHPLLLNPQQHTPLETAILAGRVDVVKQLLFWRADPNQFNTVTSSGPLGLALQQGNLEIAKILLEHGANPNYIDSSGQSFLYQMVEKENQDAVTLLVSTSGVQLELGNELRRQPPVNPDTLTLPYVNSSPLHLAIHKNQVVMATSLINAGANPNMLNAEGKTPLHLAIEKKQINVITLLLQKGAINAAVMNFNQLSAGKTALELAFETDQTIFNLLQETFILNHHEQSSNIVTNALLQAIFTNNLDGVKQAIFSGCINPNASILFNDQPYWPLHCAIENGQLDMVDFLLKVNANPLIANEANQTSFTLAAAKMKQAIEVSDETARENLNSNIQMVDNSVQTPIAARAILKKLLASIKPFNKPNIQDVDEILNQGGSPAAVNIAKKPAWSYAISQNNIELLQQLVYYGLDLDVSDESGCTPLHLAVQKKNLDMIKFLIHAGFSPYAKNKRNQTPIQLTVDETILRYFQEDMYAGEIIFNVEFDQLNQLLNQSNKAELEKYFKNYPGCIHLVNAAGDTLLHNAVNLKSDDLVSFLLTMGADPNRINSAGENALDKVNALLNTTTNKVFEQSKNAAKLRTIQNSLCRYGAKENTPEERYDNRESIWIVTTPEEDKLSQFSNNHSSINVTGSSSEIYIPAPPSEKTQLIISKPIQESGIFKVWHPFVKLVLCIENKLGVIDMPAGSNLKAVYDHVLDGGDELDTDFIPDLNKARKHVRHIQFAWASVFVIGGALFAVTFIGTGVWYSNDVIKIITVELDVYHNGTCTGSPYLKQDSDLILKHAVCDVYQTSCPSTLYDGDTFNVIIDNQSGKLEGDYSLIDACGNNQGALSLTITHDDQDVNLSTTPGTQGHAEFVTHTSDLDDMTLNIQTIKVSPSPTPSVTPTTTPSVSRTPTNSPSASRTPSITPSMSRTPTISITPSRTPMPSGECQSYSYTLNIPAAGNSGFFNPTSEWTTDSNPDGVSCVGSNCFQEGSTVTIPNNGLVTFIFKDKDYHFFTNYNAYDGYDYLTNFNVECVSGKNCNDWVGCSVTGSDLVTITSYQERQPQAVNVNEYLEDVKEERKLAGRQKNMDNKEEKVIEVESNKKQKRTVDVSLLPQTSPTPFSISTGNYIQFLGVGLASITSLVSQQVLGIATGAHTPLSGIDSRDQTDAEMFDLPVPDFQFSPGVAVGVGIGALTISVASLYALYRYALTIDKKNASNQTYVTLDIATDEVNENITEVKKNSSQSSFFSPLFNLFSNQKDRVFCEEAGLAPDSNAGKKIFN